MKKKMYIGVLVFFFILMVPCKVWASSLNEYELQFIELLSYKYEFNGAYYKVPDEYIEQVTDRLSNNSPDWDKDKYTQYKKIFFSNFSLGIKQGMFVKVGTVKKKKKPVETPNYNNQTNEEEDSYSYTESQENAAEDIVDGGTDEAGDGNLVAEESDSYIEGLESDGTIIKRISANGELIEDDADYSISSDETESENGRETDKDTNIDGDTDIIADGVTDGIADGVTDGNADGDADGNAVDSEDITQNTDIINNNNIDDTDQMRGDTELKKLGNIDNDYLGKLLGIVCMIVFLSICVVAFKKKTGKR